MIDWLRRLFGRSSPRSADVAPDPFQDRLAEFVNSADATPVSGDAPREKTGSREMIEAARQTVELIDARFQAYVRERVLKRFGNDFHLETPSAAQIRDLDLKFGDPKTGNEYRYISVSFKDRFAIVLRAQAMILSRDVQVKSLFQDLASDTFVAQELDLASWSSLSDVRWDQLFEKVFNDFFDWHRAASKQA